MPTTTFLRSPPLTDVARVWQFIFVCSLVTYEDLRTKDYIYPRWSILLGWAMTGSSLACIPAYIIYMFLSTPGSLKQVTLLLSRSRVVLISREER